MKKSAMGSSKYEFTGSLDDDDFHNRNVFYETILSWPPSNLSDKERFLLITSDDFFSLAEEYYHKKNYTFTFSKGGLRDRAIDEVVGNSFYGVVCRERNLTKE
jgi:hypothetical protein